MANVIKLKKGLDINLKGKAASKVSAANASKVYGLVPDSFWGMKPKVVVKEGDEVKAGDALFVNKLHPEMKFVSPVSGKVVLVERGERRKVLSVQVEASANQQYVDFGKKQVNSLSAEDVKKALLESGMFGFIIQRPYAVVANPDDKPKAIFVSAFSDMPLAANVNVALKGKEADFQTGVDALAKIAKVHVGVNPGSILAGTKNAEVTEYQGKCPAGNVGVQINHTCPINKGETVWTLGAEEVAIIGHLFNEGKANFLRLFFGIFDALILEHQLDLPVQVVHHILHQHGQMVLGIVHPEGLIPEIAGVDDPQKLADDVIDHFFVRILAQFDFVDVPALCIVTQNPVNDRFNSLFDGRHGHSPYLPFIPYYAPDVKSIDFFSHQDI